MNKEEVALINTRLAFIEGKLESIEALLVKMNKQTTSMERHVDFVESVYNQVKQPFHVAMRAIEKLQFSIAGEKETHNKKLLEEM